MVVLDRDTDNQAVFPNELIISKKTEKQNIQKNFTNSNNSSNDDLSSD